MTKHEQLRAYLDAIKKLSQQDEPGSVFRLTGICNVLKERNARLEQNLATVEAMLYAAEQRIWRLERKQSANRSYIKVLRKDLADKRRMLAQTFNQVVGLQRTLEGQPK